MIQFTPQAEKFFQQQSEQLKQRYWHISLKRLGCSGYQYEMSWRSEAHYPAMDMGEWYVCVDPLWGHVLNHLKVDMLQDRLGQKKVVFSNELTHSACGCGESFDVTA